MYVRVIQLTEQVPQGMKHFKCLYARLFSSISMYVDTFFNGKRETFNHLGGYILLCSWLQFNPKTGLSPFALKVLLAKLQKVEVILPHIPNILAARIVCLPKSVVIGATVKYVKRDYIRFRCHQFLFSQIYLLTLCCSICC